MTLFLLSLINSKAYVNSSPFKSFFFLFFFFCRFLVGVPNQPCDLDLICKLLQKKCQFTQNTENPRPNIPKHLVEINKIKKPEHLNSSQWSRDGQYHEHEFTIQLKHKNLQERWTLHQTLEPLCLWSLSHIYLTWGDLVPHACTCRV
jgi:hypothetical protein